MKTDERTDTTDCTNDTSTDRVETLKGKTTVSVPPSLYNIIQKVAQTNKILENTSTNEITLIPVNISPVLVKHKPSDKIKKEELAQSVHKSFNRKTNRLIDWHELSEICVEHPIVPATLKGIRNNKNFIESQCVFVDFDETISCAKFLEDCIKKRVIPNFVYQTLGCKESDIANAVRFRAVFILSTRITELKLYKAVQLAFLNVFPYADKNSFKATQFFYSGKQSQIITEMPTCVESLIDLSTSYALEQTKTDKQAKDLLYSTNKRNQRYNICIRNNESPIRKKKHFDPDKLCKSSEIFRDFDAGEIQVFHPQLRGLYSLCRQFENGVNYWINKVKNNPNIDNDKLRTIHRFIENRYSNYAEERAVKYLPDGDSGLRYGFLSEALVKKNRKARRNPNWKGRVGHKDVDAVNKEFRKHLTKALTKKGKITVLKSQAGVGKSTALLDYDLSNTIIASPNHRLNIEIEKRLRA